MRSPFSILRFSFAFLAGCIIADTVSAMEIRIVQAGIPVQAELRGEVHPGDASRIIAVLEKAKPRDRIAELQAKAPSSLYDPHQWLWLDVESSGGDLDETLAIGRYLRSANTLITTKETCNSACVFLLAGAVERVGLSVSQGRVGVHRPYPNDARGDRPADLEQLFAALHAKIVAYLTEMRVPAVLADLMFAVPPEEMYMLSANEVDLLLPERDAVWDESTVGRRAAIYGVPSAAYRQREVFALDECERNAGTAAKAILPVADCVPAHSLGIPIDAFVARKLLFSGRCVFAPGIYRVMRAGNSDFLYCLPGFGDSTAIVARNNTKRDAPGGLAALDLKEGVQGTPGDLAALDLKEGVQGTPGGVAAPASLLAVESCALRQESRPPNRFVASIHRGLGDGLSIGFCASS